MNALNEAMTNVQTRPVDVDVEPGGENAADVWVAVDTASSNREEDISHTVGRYVYHRNIT